MTQESKQESLELLVTKLIGLQTKVFMSLPENAHENLKQINKDVASTIMIWLLLNISHNEDFTVAEQLLVPDTFVSLHKNPAYAATLVIAVALGYWAAMDADFPTLVTLVQEIASLQAEIVS